MALTTGQEPADMPTAHRSIRSLGVSAVFPSRALPLFGLFVKERTRFVSMLPDVESRVISPVPYFPPLMRVSRWHQWSQVPKSDCIEGIPIVYPRYAMLPKIGGYLESRLMWPALRRAATNVHQQFDFDVIDAHYIYPSGAAAARLATRTGKPLVITCRGEDILRFPRLPIIGAEIRRAASAATRLVALSEEIAEALRALDVPENKIRVIPNGVDCDAFQPMPLERARSELGLPHGRPLILSVGNMLAGKGFDRLVDALAIVHRVIPDVLLVIVGGPVKSRPDHTPAVKSRIAAHGLEDNVRLVGAKPHNELSRWYSAADLFALLTEREGSPNVVLECLACGVPVVATGVGGILDILRDQRLGRVIPNRSAESAARVLLDSLSVRWDSAAIRRAMERQSWQSTAESVRSTFLEAIRSHGSGE